MTRILRLLLIAAVAWPLCYPAAAQNAVPPKHKLWTEKKSQALSAEKSATHSVTGNSASAASNGSVDDQAEMLDVKIPPKGNGGQKVPKPQVGDFTVADGDVTSKYVPIFGYYYDNDYSSSTSYQTRSQMIYPASMLTGMAGKYIEGVTFYTDANGIQFSSETGDGTLTVKLGVCSSNYVSSTNSDLSFSSSYTTVSKTVTPKKGDKTISVVFDDAFQYTANTNLLIEVRVTSAGTCDSDNGATNFVGTNTTNNQSLYFYSSSSASRTAINFLPKTTFGVYESFGDYTVNKEYIDFGSVTCGESATQSVTVTNTTSYPANISWEFTGLNADKFSTTVDESTVTTLAAGASQVFPITFAPGNSIGAMSGSLKVNVDNTLVQVILRGKGVKDYAASVNPTSLDLGEVLIGEDGTAKVTVTNTGQQPMTPVSTCDNAAFTVSSAAVGALASGATRDYTVTFAPTAEQDYTGKLSIKDEENGIDLSVNLKGKGVTTAAPYVVNQSASTTSFPKTVCDGTSTTPLVPIYTNYLDYGFESQVVYPAATLGLNEGDKITSLTFYASSALTMPTNGTIDNPVIVKVGEITDEPTLSGFITTGLTEMCSASVWSDEDYVTFTFNSPYYTYRGGNLVIDMSAINELSAAWESRSWYGVTSTGSGYYQTLTNSGSPNTSDVVDFLPKMTINGTAAAQSTEYVRAEVVDWGSKDAGNAYYYTQTVTINNPNSSAVEATLTTTKPFYFDTSNSMSKTATLPAGASTQTLYFNPTEAAAYTGYLTITAGEHSSKTRLTGIGLNSSTIATRDSSFFAGITYDWTDSDGHQHTSNLTEIATDPDQIIAMVKEVYTNKNIPGNYKRGYKSVGVNESGYDVTYPAVGTLKHTGSSYNSSSYYSYDDTYGWGIDTKKSIIQRSVSLTTSNSNLSSSTTAYYALMDSMEYKPNYEGVTLLLAEMVDDFNNYAVFYDSDFDNPVYDTDAYKNLRAYISNTVKSMRVVTDSKRTGSGADAGTLFKLDVDKLNKFYLLAKGRLRWVSNSFEAETNRTYTGSDGKTHYYWLYNQFCGSPCYIYTGNVGGVNGYYDEYSRQPFRYMFEQFSPVITEASTGLDDIYHSLVDMNSFGVVHDCANVADMNHQFMMYGEDSEAADCQDVRDLMFFVPDYRMLLDEDRDNDYYEKFLYYNKDHQPKVGLYVIHQDEVQGSQVSGKELYKLTLTWKTNLDEFLPGEMQEYQLWELVVDEFGVESYQPVYYRNADGSYVLDGNGNKVPIVLDRSSLNLNSEGKQTYTEVYVDMLSGSQTKTYAIRGQDKDHFLSLQMSNEQDFLIPGTDPTELVLLSSATYYSRYNPQNEKNCYSNKLQIKSNPQMIKSSYLTNNPAMTLSRSYSVANGDATQTVTEPVATIQVNYNARNMTVTLANSNILKSEFPNGQTSGQAAGYHENKHGGNDVTSWSQEYTVDNNYVNFDIILWDNFVADVSANEHPGQYIYELTFTTNGSIEGATGDNQTHAHSNEYRVPVYKTDSKISEPRTLAEVLGDTEMNPDYSPGDVEFQAEVHLSSKQNILRYDAYRWNTGEDRYIVDVVGENDEEDDLPPTGIAGNQGDYYTVTMNGIGTEDYYVGDPVGVNTTNTTNWATFVDYYPTNENTDAGAYTYAPVVELFTRGYKVGSTTEKRDDYNTYGGPLQNTAVGKLELKAYAPTANDANTENALMSDYWWEGDGTSGTAGEKYSYYKIQLEYNALDIPEGYELYKVRAWRKVDKQYLGEIMPTRRSVRIDGIDENGWYMFEDMNYGDPLTVGDNPSTMKLENLFDNGQTMQRLGARSVKIAKPQDPDATGDPQPLFETETFGEGEEAISGETRASFGARRLDTGDEDNDFPRLDVQFKVRAYFTKKTNPLISGQAPIYVFCDNGSGWNLTQPVATLYSEDGKTYMGTLKLTAAESNTSGNCYFTFSKSMGSSASDWSTVNEGRFGCPYAANNTNVSESDLGNTSYSMVYWAENTSTFVIAPGTYTLTITNHKAKEAPDLAAGDLVITKGAMRATMRDAAMTGSDFDYYVAEGECEFHQEGGSSVVTGIVQNLTTREVVGVKYYNVAGIESDTPFQGVNIVVTRYSDGSTTSTKILK